MKVQNQNDRCIYHLQKYPHDSLKFLLLLCSSPPNTPDQHIGDVTTDWFVFPGIYIKEITQNVLVWDFFFYWIIRWECIHVDACIASLFLLIVDRYPIMCPYHNNAKTVLSIRFPSPKASGTMPADLNKNDSHRFIYLNVLSLGSGTIWEGLEVWHMALLGEVYH